MRWKLIFSPSVMVSDQFGPVTMISPGLPTLAVISGVLPFDGIRSVMKVASVPLRRTMTKGTLTVG